MKVAVIDDVGFGSGKPGLFGKELYVETISKINEEILGNPVERVLLSPTSHNQDNLHVLAGSEKRLIRIFRDKQLVQKLKKLLESQGVDLVHNNLLNARYIAHTANAAEKLGTPIVTTIHGWVYVCPNGWGVTLPQLAKCSMGLQPGCGKCLYQLSKITKTNPAASAANWTIRYLMLKKMLNASKANISPSHELAEYVKRIHKISNIHAMHNPLPRHLLAEPPSNGGDDSIAFCGRLTWEKGAHLIPKIASKLPQHEIKIMGKGPLKEALVKAARKHKNITYLGYVPEKEKIKIIKESSALIMPITYRETFGYSVAEALSLGVPVVGFGLGGVKELIDRSGGGYTVKPYSISEFAEKTLKAIEEAEQLGRKGRKYAQENLNPEKYAASLQKVYEEALKNEERLIRR